MYSCCLVLILISLLTPLSQYLFHRLPLRQFIHQFVQIADFLHQRILDQFYLDAANAASLSNKLSQIANGAVYGPEKSVIPIHEHKLDALEDLIEAANGKPVLVAYWFKHDLERIRKRFKVREIQTSKDI